MSVLTKEYLNSLPVYDNCDYRLVDNSLSILIFRDGIIYPEDLLNRIVTINMERKEIRIKVPVWNDDIEDETNDFETIWHVLFSSPLQPAHQSMIECYKSGMIIAVPTSKDKANLIYARVENETNRRSGDKSKPMPNYYDKFTSWSKFGIKLASNSLCMLDQAPATARAHKTEWLMAIVTLLWPLAPLSNPEAVHQQHVIRMAAARLWSATFRAEQKQPIRVPAPLDHIPDWPEIMTEADKLMFGSGMASHDTDIMGRARKNS